MRTISTRNDTEVAKKITKPFYIMDLVLTITYRWSTLGSVLWNGQTYTPNGLRVMEINDIPGGSKEGRFSLPNHDNAASALALGEDLNDKTCRIWKLYGDEPYAVDDAISVFDGVLDGSSSIKSNEVIFGFTSEGRLREMSPRIHIAPPLFNHLPARGTVLAWAGERFELRGVDG